MYYTIRDEFISMSFVEMNDNKLEPHIITNINKGTELVLLTKELFRIKSGDSYISSTQCVVKTTEYHDPAYLAARFKCDFMGEKIDIFWQARVVTNQIASDNFLNLGSSYIRQFITIEREKSSIGEIPISEITLLQFVSATSVEYGVVDGSPVVDEDKFFFYGFEHPMAQNKKHESSTVICRLLAVPPLLPGKPQQYSATVGVYPKKELLNVAFVDYLEKERASPYHQFLHYNSWYDLRADYNIPYHDMNERMCLDRVNIIGEELHTKRNVSIESFLIDDGWDDQNSLWDFNNKFPNEFQDIYKEAAKYNFGLGVWLSPWGGYDIARERRLSYGKKNGLEINDNGFSLSGPKYYNRFLSRVENMLTKQHVNLFKFDGIGVGWDAYGAEKYATDVSAMLSIIKRLRSIKKDIFINLTIGTWASPYWLLFVDSLWRGQADVNFAGPGSARRRWISYRDSIIYANIVQRGALFPISNLMLHGIVCAKVGVPLKFGLDKVTNEDVDVDMPASMQGKGSLGEFEEEVWSFFASGTNLQELYLSPESMTPAAWDILAEAAKWARGKSEILKYSAWLGDDPGEGYIYGFSSCGKKEGILLLRNPKDGPQSTSFNLSEMFQVLKLSNKGRVFKWHAVYCGQCTSDDAIIRQLPTDEWDVETTIQLNAFQTILLSVVPEI
eukprot:Phypoly_transcript_03598.p1 GENE.Phypoly_transcript_03598~~Phypoly_transcript_03598.p1  ORF type:complete len:671 (+),score=101.68 Phypoly_transcript_03598:246-2258(+)